jgi:predicted nuclease of predicted toxin-antitoxin system
VSSHSFLVDECLPFDVTQALRNRGFDATDVVERGLRGLSDEGVWALAAAEGRILVTRDLDFPLRIPGTRPPGLVLVRAPNESTAVQLAALVDSLFDAVEPDGVSGHLVVLSPGRYRRRPW